jgi:hypothetical protein
MGFHQNRLADVPLSFLAQQGGGWRPNPDAYTSVEDVQAALRRSALATAAATANPGTRDCCLIQMHICLHCLLHSEGLESSNLIVAVDFTKVGTGVG